jgi:hypothetical protein
LIFIPEVKPGESKEDYISRCIAYCIKEEGLTQEQAAGKCYGMWKEQQNQDNLAIPTLDESKEAFMKRCKLEKATEVVTYPNITLLHAELTALLEQNTSMQTLKEEEIQKACDNEWKNRPTDTPTKPDPGPDQGDGRDSQQGSEEPIKTRVFNGTLQRLYCFNCEQITPLLKTDMSLDDTSTKATITFNTDSKNDFKATCVIGDRFYKGKYLSMTELQKNYKSMDGSYHDINHWGTTYLDGNPNIEYIVGYQDNANLDKTTKALTADVHIVETARNYDTWRGFFDINKAAKRIQNVSVSFFASNKKMKASELGIDFAAQGYRADDEIEYLYDLEFQGLSSIFKGACSDKDGCGIHKQDAQKQPVCNDKSCEDKQNKRILEDKIKRIKGKE